MKRFGIIGHTKRPSVKSAAETVIHWLQSRGFEFCICEDLAELLGDRTRAVERDRMWQHIDFLISLGGDGTMLAAVRSAGHHGVPILGVNVGSLGFLTEVGSDEIPAALEALTAGRYFLDQRMVLEASSAAIGKYYALNDVVFDNGADTRLVRLDLYLGDQFVCSYNADGLIISTPTGSTAYNLAAGGPIVYFEMAALIACPICPHSLTLRPIIFTQDSQIVVKAADPNVEVRMTADGQVHTMIKPLSDVLVRKASHTVKLIRLKQRSFFDIMRTKLHLGARPLTTGHA